jgi:hypothetical protein
MGPGPPDIRDVPAKSALGHDFAWEKKIKKNAARDI